MPDFDHSLRQIMEIRGTPGASVIDQLSGHTVASTGDAGQDDREAADLGPMDVVRAAVNGPAFAKPAAPGFLEDIVITSSSGYHLMHFLPDSFDARLVFYVRLDRSEGNLAMAQHTLRSIGSDLSTR